MYGGFKNLLKKFRHFNMSDQRGLRFGRLYFEMFFHRFVGRVTDEPSTRIKTGIVTSESQEMVALIDMAGHAKSTQ